MARQTCLSGHFRVVAAFCCPSAALLLPPFSLPPLPFSLPLPPFFLCRRSLFLCRRRRPSAAVVLSSFAAVLPLPLSSFPPSPPPWQRLFCIRWHCHRHRHCCPCFAVFTINRTFLGLFGKFVYLCSILSSCPETGAPPRDNSQPKDKRENKQYSHLYRTLINVSITIKH